MTHQPVRLPSEQAIDAAIARFRARHFQHSEPVRSEWREILRAAYAVDGVGVEAGEGEAPEMAAFDRAEFNELLREAVALREWKAAHEAAAFGGSGVAARIEELQEALVHLVARHDDDKAMCAPFRKCKHCDLARAVSAGGGTEDTNV